MNVQPILSRLIRSETMLCVKMLHRLSRIIDGDGVMVSDEIAAATDAVCGRL